MNDSNATSSHSDTQLKPRSLRQVETLTSPKHEPPQFERGRGVRHDRIFSHDDALKTRSNAVLVNAGEEMYRRRGRGMSQTDANTLNELAARTWDFYDCDACHFRGLPSWLACEVANGRRHPGFSYFLGIVIAAYRAGACGIWISYSEAMALFNVGSEGTWRAWCKIWESKGLVTIVQTWTDDPAGEYGRVHGRLWYRLGPTLEQFAAALCEDACGASTNQRSVLARAAASAERREQRRRTQSRVQELQHRREPHNDPKRRTRRKPGEVKVTEVPPDPAPKVDERRLCKGDYLKASEVTRVKPADPSPYFDSRNALQPAGVIQEKQKPIKNETTARARSSDLGRAPARRGPPGAAARIMVLEHAMRGLRSRSRASDVSPTVPDSAHDPDSMASRAKRDSRSLVPEGVRRDIRDFLLRHGASARQLAETLHIELDEAAQIRAEFFRQQSVIADEPTKSTSPTAEEPPKLRLPDDVLAGIERLTGRRGD